MYKTDVVVAAAGRGKRVGAAQNKLLLNLNQNSDRNEKACEDKLFGKNVTTLLEYGLKTFQEHPGIRNIFLVVSKKDFQILQPWAKKEGFILGLKRDPYKKGDKHASEVEIEKCFDLCNAVIDNTNLTIPEQNKQIYYALQGLTNMTPVTEEEEENE